MPASPSPTTYCFSGAQATVNQGVFARIATAAIIGIGLAIAVSPSAFATGKRTARAPAASTESATPAGVADRPAVRDFVREMVENHRFDEPALLKLFGQVRTNAEVLRLIAPAKPGFKRSWPAYRNRFLDPLRIREGVKFWREHQETISRATTQYGVPGEIIVAIIGVETLYGRIMGEYRVIDALTTLAFEDPRRPDYFRRELANYLLHTRDNQLDPLALRGSYAGAIGIPQFMPGSIRRFAVDYDGDAVIDLRASPADAIGSVARYLAEHGWRSGEPTHYPTRFDDIGQVATLLENGIEPRFTRAQFEQAGAILGADVPAQRPLALIDLPDGDAAPTYVLGASNFYVITRYNQSSFYAMAVIELAATLKAARQP